MAGPNITLTAMARFSLAVDIGGTFTDAVLRAADGSVREVAGELVRISGAKPLD